MSKSENSDVGVRVAGGQAHPQKFWFGENPAKICGIVGEICEIFRKIASCALIFKKWCQKSKCRLFILEVIIF